MLRRVHDILSRKFPKWVLEDRTEPLDWSVLPVEIKREIVKNTDFQTRCRLRQCSYQDHKIVDSLHIDIPFVRIETDRNYVSMMICESKKKILRLDMTKKKLRLRKKFVMTICDNIYGNNRKEVHSNNDFDSIVESFLCSISRSNISILTLNLHLRFPNDIIRKFLDTHYRPKTGPRRKTRILCSGLEFLVAQVHFLPVDEVRVINDLIADDSDGRLMFAGKKYNVSPMGHFAVIKETSFWKPTLLHCNLGALISGIMWKINTEMEYYYIPGLKVPEHGEYCDRFDGRMTKHGDTLILHIPVANSTRKLFVVISECGVVIKKANTGDVLNIPKDKCMLDWMCPKCDRSVESWYFRSLKGCL